MVLPDSAVGYLLDHETVDAVILGAEWIAANGDTSNVDRQPDRGGDGRGRAPRSGAGLRRDARDHDRPRDGVDGRRIPIELRPGREIVTHLSRAGSRSGPSALLPALDVTPAARITAIVTEMGILEPVPEALAAALAARSARRSPIGPAYQAPAASRDEPGRRRSAHPGRPRARRPDDDEDEDGDVEDGS